jgi:acetyl-CoA carboxylase biotin carboxylase subunit
MKRVLVANRGEIALRIIRACDEEGLEAVAVYSDADRYAPHVHAADHAVRLGPPPAAESYLVIERLLDAARSARADAVHPGYGFLAERATFADAVVDAGLIFVGPPAQAIRAMGEKTGARQRMRDAGVPVVPGTVDPVTDAEEAARVAADIGYPVLLKAVSGGGGKGMRKADDEAAVRRGFPQAVSEAQKAFGDGSVYLERFIESPRHVEIQVLADASGRTVHLGERECSVQRRHQKLIEEAPSPAVDLRLRMAMGDAAVRAAESVGYRGAGTVEFLLDASGEFYFLEMNTRIQVEHPVTEMVYGIDLVREQLRIAAGQPSAWPDHPLKPRGHAIECRITSEDPFADFLPATGKVEHLVIPSGPGVRWDGGIDVGNEIGLYYDPLLAKLVVWAEDRPAAIRRMRRALRDLVVVGVPTSQAFHLRVMDDATFASGAYSIRYLDEHGKALLADGATTLEAERAAIAAVLAEESERRMGIPTVQHDAASSESAWQRAARLNGLR